MTNDDIIKAAFKVWGRELYRTTSLTQLAQELGVSKAALYRHFKNKDALLEAMYTAFFDECAAFIKTGYDKAVAVEDEQERCLIMMRATAEYYIRKPGAFVFSLIRVYSRREQGNIGEEFRARGIDMRRLMHAGNDSSYFSSNYPSDYPSIYPSILHYPSVFQLIMASLVFHVAQFHRVECKQGEIPSEEQVKGFLDRIENRIKRGLELDVQKTAALDYGMLEKRAAQTPQDTEDDALLKAVAGAVAEAGPWNASMEMVARRSGLSKSSLYSHFKNRQDMMGRFFITEFSRLADFAKAHIESAEEPEEQLYLGIISIVQYLRSRPEILVTMDWIKARRLELMLDKEVSERLYHVLGSIKLEAVRKQDQDLLVHIANWILFMIVNTMIWRPSRKGENSTWVKQTAELPNESFRLLFRFIALGLDGFNGCLHGQ